jgi:hypothetical protein
MNTCLWPQSRGVWPQSRLSRTRETIMLCVGVMWTWLSRVLSGRPGDAGLGPSHGARFLHRFGVSSESVSHTG